MKLLLCACIMCVAFAKKRFHFIGEKFLSSSEEDYNGNRYPLNPSLNIPYPTPDNDFTPPYYPPGNDFPNYPGNPDPRTGVPPYPWILTVPGAPLYHIPSFPLPIWLAPPSSSGWRASPFVPPSSRPVGPFGPPNAAVPAAGEPDVTKPPVATPPDPELVAVEPAVIEPDETEPAAATPAAAIPPAASPAAAIPPAATSAAASPAAASPAALGPAAPETQPSPFLDQVTE
ncbi:PREDICTED: proline-rich protein 27 [Ceratotherium simum simum]|uniref:Proline-rich protein 27 n=1 Tax=Ceratotherium simum simum TaxID=73337 RepID=A0ABM1CJV0_CERSS|nr:PREDICTED: proline-rich protein 27 [Ceratotherium simum simum]